MNNQKINELAFAKALAVWSALVMLILGILGNLGIYSGAVNMMQGWHMFSNTGFSGIIGGIIEAAIISFVFGYAFAVIYNSLLPTKDK